MVVDLRQAHDQLQHESGASSPDYGLGLKKIGLENQAGLEQPTDQVRRLRSGFALPVR
jgi:hypothetical protein